MNYGILLFVFLAVLFGVPTIIYFFSSFLYKKNEAKQQEQLKKEEEIEKISGIIIKIDKQEKKKRFFSLFSGIFILLVLMIIWGDKKWQREVPLILQTLLFIICISFIIYGLKILFINLKKADREEAFLNWKNESQQSINYFLGQQKLSYATRLIFLVLAVFLAIGKIYPFLFTKTIYWLIFILGIVITLILEIRLRKKYGISFNFLEMIIGKKPKK